MHLALTRGQPDPGRATLVRVHSTAVLRDLLGTTIPGRNSWRFDASLRAIAKADCGVLVVLGKSETSDELIAGIEAVLDPAGVSEPAPATDSYALVGIGAQILRDQGVGRIHLLGAPVKYNALSGFGLEVEEFVPAAPSSGQQSKE